MRTRYRPPQSDFPTYDRRYDTIDPDQFAALNASGMVALDQPLSPLLLMAFGTTDGRVLRLGDFGSAAFGGNLYRSWLNVISCTNTGFTEGNPRREGVVA